jgi:response regulator RpfG family c-di-GMP phosphodiesterase
LEDDVDVIASETWDQAVKHLDVEKPHLIVVCYAFDEMQPFRFIHHARQYGQGSEELPIILVRAIPAPLGDTNEAQIREAYESLGIDEFFNLIHEAEVHGPEVALQRFRTSGINRLVGETRKGGFRSPREARSLRGRCS